MQLLHAAIYARVSSDQQTADKTIASQLAALEARLAQEGLRVAPEHRFLDEGYSGDTLVRPALARPRHAGPPRRAPPSRRGRRRPARSRLRALARPAGAPLRLPGPAGRRAAPRRGR